MGSSLKCRKIVMFSFHEIILWFTHYFESYLCGKSDCNFFWDIWYMWRIVIIVIWTLFSKMPVNQKPLNRIGIFWYQFTPRKLLYLLVSLYLVKFGPHWLSVFFWGGGGAPCIPDTWKIERKKSFSQEMWIWSCHELTFWQRVPYSQHQRRNNGSVQELWHIVTFWG